MPEPSTFLHVRASGRELLIPAADLREVVPFAPVTPLPGGVPGIQGVVLYQGEFLPVFDWQALPGHPEDLPPASLMAVLRPRLGLPIERLLGTLEMPEGGWQESPGDDSWNPILAGHRHVEAHTLPVLDPDRLVALLHRLRKDR